MTPTARLAFIQELIENDIITDKQARKLFIHADKWEFTHEGDFSLQADRMFSVLNLPDDVITMETVSCALPSDRVATPATRTVE